MKRSVITGVTCLAMSVLLTFTGCSGSSSSSKPANTNGESNSSKAGTASTMSLWGTVPTSSQWKDVYSEFQKENPNIKIDYWRGETSDYTKKLQVAMAGDEGPDVLFLQPDLVVKYKNFLEPLDDYAAKDIGSNWKSALSSDSYLAEVSSEGKTYALPMLVTGQQCVLYNKTLFDKCGISKTPTTLDEWVQDAKTLAAKGMIPVAAGFKDSWACTDMFLSLNAQVAPGSVYDAIDGKLPWTDSQIVKTMDLWKKVYGSGLFEKGSLGIATYPDARDQYFYSTKSAMLLVGSWHLSFALPDGEKFQNGVAIGKDETGAFLLPQAGEHETRTIASVDSAYGINKSSKNKDAAWKFVKFMYNGKGEKIMVDTLQGFSALKDVSVSESSLSKLAPSDRSSYETIVKAFQNPIGKRSIPYSSISDALSVAMQTVASGTQTSQQALKTVQDASASVNR